MGKENIEQELRDYFENEARKQEPPQGWWNGIVTRAIAGATRSRRHGFWTRTRWAIAAVPLAILLIGGTVYGATVANRGHFNISPPIDELGLAQAYELTQTIDDVTVSFERAYADANVVMAGFVISGPASNYYIGGITLSTADGKNLKGMMGLGTTSGSDSIIGNWQASERNACVYSSMLRIFTGKFQALICS